MSYLHEIWLCNILKYDPEKIYKYINFFGSAENAYNAKASKYKKHEAYPILSKVIKANHDLDDARLLIEQCKRMEIDIMSIHDEDYPVSLKNSYLPPRLLFLKGERLNLNEYLTITIVGSRSSTRNGKLMAYELGRDLAKEGVIIVSGLARGIDSESQKGALDAGNKTVAILAGGVDIPYPNENSNLYNQIVSNGMLISEQPPGTPSRDYFYQQRNRIMASLSYGCVLVEGCVSSGTAITMKHATSENRDLFAVPGNPKIDQSYIPNSLIKDGAVLVTDYTDILKVYEDKYDILLENGKRFLPQEEIYEIENLDFPLEDTDIKILKFLSECGDAQHADNICEACNLPPGTVASRLTMLLMGEIISQEPGNKYLLIRR